MKPEEPRFTDTESGCREEKYSRKDPSFKTDNEAESKFGLFKASGHFATLLSSTASILESQLPETIIF